MHRKSLFYTSLPLGRVWFYADENIDESLVIWLRDRGYHVESAHELGFGKSDDEFHPQETARRNCILLSGDVDFLDDSQFPFHALTRTGVVVLGTCSRGTNRTQYGYMLLALEKEAANSGTKNFVGLKIALRGPRVLVKARVRGRVRSDEIDISKPIPTRELFMRSDEHPQRPS